MTTAVKTGLILTLALVMTGNGMAERNKTTSGLKTNEKMKTATTSGQSNISSTDQTEDLSLFPLTNTLLHRL